MAKKLEQVISKYKQDTPEFAHPEKRGHIWLENSPVCTKILDLDFNLQYMSAAGVQALNMNDVTLFYGKPYPFDFYPESFKTTMTGNLKKALETHEVIEQEAPVVDVDGKELWFHSIIVPVKDDKGQIEYLMVLSSETSERKQLEEELRKSHTLFSQAEQIGKIGHWEWDVVADQLITCSEQYAKIFDMTVDEELDPSSYDDVTEKFIHDVEEFIHEDDRERYIQVTEYAYAHKEGWDVEFRIITKTGKVVYVRELGEPVLDDHGTLIRTIGTLQDISEHKHIEEQLTFQANHDALTGLVNRLEFERRSERLLSTIRQDKAEHALCFMDLDQFKVVNDTCGHTAGDELLRQLSKVLNHEVRKRDTLARLGGDEFGVLMEHCSLEHANRVARTLQKAVQDYQFSWEAHTFKIGVSIGLVAITETTPDLSELMKQADAACYMAKDMGRNRIHVYHGEDETLAQRHGEMQWVTRIHKALEEDKFYLYAQPIVPLDSRTDIHYEILIRMKGEKGELIPPGAFLPAAERYNLIAQLDRWVIKNTFALLMENPRFLEQINFISINLSGQSLTENNVLDFIIMQLDESGIDGTKICFEITETAAISNLSTATKFISTLKGLGCRFALDDFGSGLSSFGYLKNLSVNYLKIDGMFVKDIVDDPIDHAMVKSINEIGQVMGMQTIAEFVENDEIKGMLREIGVNYAQGYGIGKPQPFDKLLGRSNNLTNINGH